jgi:hypothetical protein
MMFIDRVQKETSREKINVKSVISSGSSNEG